MKLNSKVVGIIKNHEFPPNMTLIMIKLINIHQGYSKVNLPIPTSDKQIVEALGVSYKLVKNTKCELKKAKLWHQGLSPELTEGGYDTVDRLSALEIAERLCLNDYTVFKDPEAAEQALS